MPERKIHLFIDSSSYHSRTSLTHNESDTCTYLASCWGAPTTPAIPQQSVRLSYIPPIIKRPPATSRARIPLASFSDCEEDSDANWVKRGACDEKDATDDRSVVLASSGRLCHTRTDCLVNARCKKTVMVCTGRLGCFLVR
jgi:hypothetical protein